MKIRERNELLAQNSMSSGVRALPGTPVTVRSVHKNHQTLACLEAEAQRDK